MDLVPLLCVAIVAVLVVLQVSEQRRADRYTEGIGFVGANRNEVGRHVPTVQVAGDAAGHIRDLMLVEIIRRIEVHTPAFGRLDVAVEAQGVGEPILKLPSLPVEFSVA